MVRTMIAGTLATALMVLDSTRAADDPPAGGPAAPLPQHKVLAREVGVWDAEVTMTVPGADADAKPTTSKAVETNALIGDKWLISDFKGEFGGMEFQGHGQTGYDAKKGKYVGTWVDTFSARIDTLEGTFDEKTQTMTMFSQMEEPGSGKPMKVKFVSVFKGDNERIFTEHVMTEGAKDYTKLMQISYKKRAK